MDKTYIKKSEWDMAIGLQDVDNLKPSKYLEKLKDKYIFGSLTIEDTLKELKEYYSNKEDINYKELECDFVSTRIVELLNNKNFELSIEFFKYYHYYLFQDVFEFAGEFRKVNIFKKEKILNYDTVIYGDYSTLIDSLEYDISLEKEKDYRKMNMNEVIDNITRFSSGIWQVHPFREGNTRTTALFIERYLISLGFTVDNSLFKDKSFYYRNALVRSNYYNHKYNIKEDNSYLIKFYENLLLNKNNDLNTKDLIIKELY